MPIIPISIASGGTVAIEPGARINFEQSLSLSSTVGFAGGQQAALGHHCHAMHLAPSTFAIDLDGGSIDGARVGSSIVLTMRVPGEMTVQTAPTLEELHDIAEVLLPTPP